MNGDIDTAAWALSSCSCGSALFAYPVHHIFPDHGECVKPAAPEPGTVYLGIGCFDDSSEGSLGRGFVSGRSLPEDETAFCGQDFVLAVTHGHEVKRVKGKHRVNAVRIII